MNFRKHAIATALTVLISSPVFAATDGSLGSTSTGQVDLDLEVLDSVAISSLDNIDFGQYGGSDTGDINSGDSYCVYVNGGDDYNITPTSSNGKFALVGTLGDEINYKVKLAGAATGASSQSAVSYNTASSTYQGSYSLTCNSTDNASVDVSITESELRKASTDTYSDTLILMVSPI